MQNPFNRSARHYPTTPPVRTEGHGPFFRIVGKLDKDEGRIVNVKVRSWTWR